MLKKLALISTAIVITSLVTGCTVSHKAPTCAQLKRQWLYNITNPNNEATWITETQKAKLKQQLIDNHCE